MNLHIAIKEIVKQKGVEIIKNVQIINYLLDYQAFKEKPATKLILRDVINGGYAEEISSLKSQDSGWTMSFIKLKRDFIDSCGYKDELVDYVFEAIAYGIGMGDASKEPKIEQKIDVQSFFDIAEEPLQEEAANSPVENNQNVNQSDLYSIALTFYNEGKYKQAKAFIDKSISLFANSGAPADLLKLKGDICLKLGIYEEAINTYHASYTALANKTNYNIPKLKESLKNHEIKGFENSYFCYHFCLYSIGKINKEQWLKIVKSEAMYGLNDAIMYCVNNGINPMEDHINIFFVDKADLRTGDFIYSDGTFAHELSSAKKVIAKVIVTENSEYEKNQGWTHGYLIPVYHDGSIQTIRGEAWSYSHEDLPFPHSHYTNDDINHWDKLKTIESEQFITINDYDLFPAFKAIRNFPVKLPISEASPWFLPSIHWFKRCFISNLISSHGGYWTSSQADTSNALCVKFGLSSYKRSYFTTTSYELADKKENKLLLPVSAF